jgi:hypothetical protein
MEPENVADYSKVSYWDSRYEKEPTYDWFSSAYPECLSRIMEELWTRFGSSSSSSVDSDQEEKQQEQNKKSIRVLHLGTGNSRLVHDLATSWYAKCKEHNISNLDLVQVAIDYSEIVIENMKKGDQPVVGPKVEWIVADVRDLSNIVPKQEQEKQESEEDQKERKQDEEALLFDVVIDKGTMDALQADKESDTLDEDIDAMLKETSRVLKSSTGSAIFIQVTWEVTPFRKHWTMREEYGWKNGDFKSIGLNPDDRGDCLYRILRYVKKSN